MLSKKKAFTLIELLVVVLIIGILAAVAVPQYQKAVLKSRLTQLDVVVDSAQKAVQLYLLANGGFPQDTVYFTGESPVGDITIPGNPSGNYNYSSVGRLQAYCISSSCYIINLFKYGEDGTDGAGIFSSGTVRMANKGNGWYIYQLALPNTLLAGAKLLCQWAQTREYPVSSSNIQDNCAAYGITLELKE